MDTNLGRLNRCPDARALLAEYVEGELAPIEARRIEGHLSLCAGCRREETEYRAAMGALGAPRELAAHGDLYSGFAEKLGNARPRANLRHMPLRWAAASCLILAVAGASASYFRSAFSPAPVPMNPVIAQAITPKPHPLQAKAADQKSVVRNAPEPKFEWKNDTPANDKNAGSAAAIPDPFDAGRVVRNDSPRESMDTSNESDSRPSGRHHRRTTVATGERRDFLGVKPVHGPSADEIIIQKRREVTVAQYAAPQPTDDAAHAPTDHGQPVRPFVVATDPESKSATSPSPASNPVAMSPADESEVMVNGKPTDVQTAVGYDRRGRPVLVKMNIGAKPEREKLHPEK